MVAPAAPQTVEEYIAHNPNADPKALLDVLLAQNTRYQQEYRREYQELSEVAMDADFRFKPTTLAQLFRLGRVYVDSGVAGKQYEGNIPAASVAVQMALQAGVNPFMFLHKTYPVNGKIGFETQLAMAMLELSGLTERGFRFETERDDEGKIVKCTASVIDKKTGDELSMAVTWDHVIGEGWEKMNGSQKSKWVTIPDVMFQYRSAIWVIRTYYPGILMGMYSMDELEEIDGAHHGNGAPAAAATGQPLAELSERLGAAPAEERPKRPRKAAQTEQAAETGSAEETPAAAAEPAKPVDKPAEPAKARKSNPLPAPEETAEKSASTNSTSPGNTAPAEKKATKAAAAPQTAKVPTPEEKLISYMRARYDEDVCVFDLPLIARQAVKEPNPNAFVDRIFQRKDPTFEAYLAPPADDVDQTSPAETDQSGDWPECVRDPLTRPTVLDDGPGKDLEQRILQSSSPAKIKDLVKEAMANPALQSDEAAYLQDYGERRAWYLAKGREPPKEPFQGK